MEEVLCVCAMLITLLLPLVAGQSCVPQCFGYEYGACSTEELSKMHIGDPRKSIVTNATHDSHIPWGKGGLVLLHMINLKAYQEQDISGVCVQEHCTFCYSRASYNCLKPDIDLSGQQLMPDHFCIVSDHAKLKFSSHRHNFSPAVDSYN